MTRQVEAFRPVWRGCNEAAPYERFQLAAAMHASIASTCRSL
jgi:hypothetical protein